MYDYNYYYSRLYDVFKVQCREEETEKIFDKLIDDFGFKKATEKVMKLYEQYFD